MSTADGAQAAESEKHAALLEDALFQVKRVIVGQDRMVERTLVCLLARGHCLIEGVPGLAKTLTVSTLADVIGGSFARLQFTPDLVPADIVGTRIWRPSREEFDIEWGPVFANLVLADEINRAPAKVQSALLEVMAERQVSIAGRTEPLPNPFLVLATQNPIESEGVYALPEAQRDRFLMQIVVDQPSYVEEIEIARRMGVSAPEGVAGVVDRAAARAARRGRRGVRAPRSARLRGSDRDDDARAGSRRSAADRIAHRARREPARDARHDRRRPGAGRAARPAVPHAAGRLRRRSRDSPPPLDPLVRRARRRRHDRRRHRGRCCRQSPHRTVTPRQDEARPTQMPTAGSSWLQETA